jgi:hypothetical protein
MWQIWEIKSLLMISEKLRDLASWNKKAPFFHLALDQDMGFLAQKQLWSKSLSFFSLL